MNGRIDSGLGQIVIDTDVIATYGSYQYEGWPGQAFAY